MVSNILDVYVYSGNHIIPILRLHFIVITYWFPLAFSNFLLETVAICPL